MEFELSVYSIFLLVTFAQSLEIPDCYTHDRDPYLLFGKKTAYEFVYEKPKIHKYVIQDCDPVQIWMLARHGTSYPEIPTIRELTELQELRIQIIRNHEERKEGRLCYLDLDNLKTWKYNLTHTDANRLTRQGRQDVFFLAKRIHTKFSRLFAQGYSQNLFWFRHSDTERTRASAQIFSEGLFGKETGVWIPRPLENDSVLSPFNNCSKYHREVTHNFRTIREVEMFRTSQDMNTLIHNVSRRLGFLYDLNKDTIFKMFEMCRLNKAWDVNGRSPWCAAFVKPELLLLEYLEDLQSYYDAGYGNPYAKELGCAPLRDMFEGFADLENESPVKNQPNGIFYFTHSKMITMLLARLGLFHDQFDLRHDNYRMHYRRQWRTSNISPFMSNLQAVFYKCNHGDANRVMFYLQERPVLFEGCEHGLCSWGYLKDRFANIVKHCDLRWCNSAESISALSSVILLFFTIFQFVL